MADREARKEARKKRADNAILRIGAEAPPTRIQTTAGVVLNINGVSPATLQIITDVTEDLHPTPDVLSVEHLVDPGRPDLAEKTEILTTEQAEFWAKKDEERYGNLRERFARWQVDMQRAQNQQAAFVSAEMIRFGVSVDAEATDKAGGELPGFAMTWRDRVPDYQEDEQGDLTKPPPTDWELYLMYAIPNTEDFGAVMSAVLARTEAPTGEGVAAAVELFRGYMAQRAKGQLARFARAQGAAAESGQDGDQPLDVGAEPEDSPEMENEAG